MSRKSIEIQIQASHSENHQCWEQFKAASSAQYFLKEELEIIIVIVSVTPIIPLIPNKKVMRLKTPVIKLSTSQRIRKFLL